jgi:hypothetical protein
VTDPKDLEAVIAVESLTNARLRDEIGDISLVPPEDRVSGPGASVIMPAFTHLNSGGGRFSDGSFRVFYAAKELETVIAKTKHHRERSCERPARGAWSWTCASTSSTWRARCIMCARRDELATIYDAEDYAASRRLAAHLRAEGSNGIAYDSVRRTRGACAAVFRPRLLSNCRQERHLCYVWDGTRIETMYEKRALGAAD